MWLFFLRRLLLAILACMTVMVISFTLTRLSGNLAASIAGPNASAADIAIITKNYGLDRPLPVQFLDWARHAAEGDLGRSYLYHVPVWTLIRQRLPITLTLGLTAIVIALAISIPLGIIAAAREGTIADRAIMLVALIGQAMPSFWLGLVLIIYLALDLQWFPISGVDSWRGYILPAIVLAFSAVPALTRLTRSGMIEALAADYIRTARAKGLSRSKIVLKHALRNAAMPVVAITAVQLGYMLGGSVVIEAVFALPGIGYLAWDSITKNDFPVVQAIVLFLALIYIALTLLADLVNALLDPRLRR
jgi:ABC-type dipeptide/oligopeptide/nickel transport system permease component